MRKSARLVTTAGVTVLGLTAMSGVAQADTGGHGLPLDLTGVLGKTVDTVGNVVKQTTSSPRSSEGSGLHVSVPVHVNLGAPHRSRGHSAPPSSPGVKAGVKASVKAAAGPLSVRAALNLRLCVPPRQECVPSPPSPIPPGPPAPPTPPPTPPVGLPLPQAPGTAAGPALGALTVAGNSLPFTGGPIGALTLLGAGAVLTGAAGIAGSRRKAAEGA
jgi:hypothetical protein